MLQVAPESFEMVDFSLGLNWVNAPDSLDQRELLDAKNFNITQTKGLEKRKGCTQYKTATATASKQILDQMEYISPASARRHLVAIDTKLRCYYNSQWNDVYTGLTTGIRPTMSQFQGMVFYCNGVNDSFKVWDIGGNSAPLKTAQLGIDPPLTRPACAANAGQPRAQTGRYRYKYCYVRWQQVFRIYCSATDATSASLTFDGTTLTGVITGGNDAGTLDIVITEGHADDADTIKEMWDDHLNKATTGWNANGWTCVRRIGTESTFLANDSSVLLPFPSADVLGKSQAKILMADTPPMLVGNPSAKSALVTLGERVKEEVVYSAVAGTSLYTGNTTTYDDIVPGSVQISFVKNTGTRYMEDIPDSETATTGKFEGRGLDPDGTSTIDYESGALVLDIDGQIKLGTDIVVSYATGKTCNVTFVASTDAQVNAIALYRTLDLSGGDLLDVIPEGDEEDIDSEEYFRVAYADNRAFTFEDDKLDDELGGSMQNDNSRPPNARYVKVHKNRIFYGYCMDEAQGDSLVVFSKSNQGEACPKVNYQFVDRDDGDIITGMAAFGDYFVIFKTKKIFVIEGDFEALYTIDLGIGCIDSHSVIEFRDKVFFLSEEGYMAFDGRSLYCVSEKVNNLVPQKYFTISKWLEINSTGSATLRSASSTMDYSGVYYPERRQIWILAHDSVLDPFVLVGHFLEDLDPQAPTRLVEQANPLIAWTYHRYTNHTLCHFGLYTDSAGTTRIRAGDEGGFLYNMDNGLADVNSAGTSKDIPYSFKTGWMTLNHPPSITKTVRIVNMGYFSGAALADTDINIDVDFESSATDTIEIVGGAALGSNDHPGDKWGGDYQFFNENLRASATGNHFRVRIDNGDGDQVGFGISRLTLNYRLEGVRFWTPTRT